MAAKRLSISILQLLLITCMAAGQNIVRTEREQLVAASDSAARTVIESAGLRKGSMISLKLSENKFINFYKPVILERLTTDRITVLQNGGADTTLELSVRESSIWYGKTFSENIFGERKVERISGVTFFVTESEFPSAKVLLAKSVSFFITDTVTYADAADLHAADYPLTAFTKPALSFVDTFLEPMIITIASGVAVYLFFTIRS